MGCSNSSVSQLTHQNVQLGQSSKPGGVSRGDFHHRYALQQKIGKGTFAQVYRVKLTPDHDDIDALERDMAVKVTDLRKKTEDATTKYRTAEAVQKEVLFLRRLATSDAVVQVYDDCIEDSFAYIVMELCDFTLLAALERLPELNERSLVVFLRQMLDGLHATHEANIVHRDVKPDNFICKREATQDGFPIVKLCDFGMAADLKSSQSLRGNSGTAPYMSPEMLGKRVYDTKTDMWSFFVICHVLLLGGFPYRPAQDSEENMKNAIRSGVPQPSFASPPDLAQLSTPATAFLNVLFARDPDKRPSAKEALQVIADSEHDNSWGSVSLRPTLNATKRAGVFDLRRAHDEESEVDDLLKLAQLKSNISNVETRSCSSSRSGAQTSSSGSTQSQCKQ